MRTEMRQELDGITDPWQRAARARREAQRQRDVYRARRRGFAKQQALHWMCELELVALDYRDEAF